MPEGSNIEIAHQLHEHGGHGSGGSRTRFERILEIGEAVLLAMVAIATAYSGYQSARWDGRSAERYAEASKLRVEQDLIQTQAGQQLLYNTDNLDAWIVASTAGDKEAADIFARRFTPNYAVAFEAWLELDPLTNPDAPSGPRFMPEYESPLDEKAADLDEQAAVTFEEGTTARERGEDYVRVTVLLAMVLFLIAISQRFQVRNVRLGLMGLGLAILLGSLVMLLSFPAV